MSLRIVSIDEMPLAEIHYLNAASGGGAGVERLPITIARTTRLGEELDAIVICSDLQGIVRGRDDATELFGVHEDGEDGDLIRKYLVGVLGVRLEMPMGAVRYKLRLHLFHAQENQDELANAFLPVPQTVLRPKRRTHGSHSDRRKLLVHVRRMLVVDDAHDRLCLLLLRRCVFTRARLQKSLGGTLTAPVACDAGNGSFSRIDQALAEQSMVALDRTLHTPFRHPVRLGNLHFVQRPDINL
jgi:hypothetical protein